MFIAGAVVVGGIIVAYSDTYGDSEVVDRHNAKVEEYNAKLGEVKEQRRIVQNQRAIVAQKQEELNDLYADYDYDFRRRIENLRNEKYYSALGYSDADDVVENVRAEMEDELENEIQQEKAELARIDEMIAKINELELQAKEA